YKTMNAFSLAVLCAVLVAVSASGVAIVPATAHGGAIAGHGAAAAVIAGPGGIVGPAGIVGHGLGLGGLGLGGLGVLGHGLVGSGIEGQYVPSGNELLYDDGSYRPEHHYAGDHGLGLGLGLGLGHGLIHG
ncbi:hypothetical protein AMK59_1976, partial [Oryctes borbonicus]